MNVCVSDAMRVYERDYINNCTESDKYSLLLPDFSFQSQYNDSINRMCVHLWERNVNIFLT